MKTLNLGCGNRTFKEYPPGYSCINYDLREDLPNVDEVGDVKFLDVYLDNEFDYILASDIIEHFKIADTTLVLKEWMRVLKPNGIIEFRLPNLKVICEKYVKGIHNAKMTSWLLYGGQDYAGNFHYVGFDREFFKDTCLQVGLEEIDYKEEGNNMVIKMRNKK